MSKKDQVTMDYLAAFKAANGQEARLEPCNDGVVVIAADGSSTGIAYSRIDLVRLTTRLIERAAFDQQQV